VGGAREDEVDVVSGDDVCDEDVRAEEVVGVEEEKVDEDSEEEKAMGVVEDETKVDVDVDVDEDEDEDVLSTREEVDGADVLTLEEVGAAVLLAWLLDPPPAVPDGDLSSAIYP
jgi:hypothetical protein